MLAFLAYGTLLGLSAGISPGPLLTLVIAQTLQHGAREGIKVALAPLLTDLPIIGAALLLFSQLPQLDFALAVVSFLGAAFISWLGILSLRQKPVTLDAEAEAPRSILKGLLINAFSPHPYLFWFGVGTPTLLKAAQLSVEAAVGFALCFFVFICGSKTLIAILVGRSRALLGGRPYVWVMRVLGGLLLLFAGILVRDGLLLLKLI